MAIHYSALEYKLLVSRNQLRLMDFCDDCISVIKDSNLINLNMLLLMHTHSMALILDSAGEFRREDVHITYSDHVPPSHNQVKVFTLNYLHEISSLLENKEPIFYVAAYTLWRLNWIHPFEDGNGRLSRALAYIIITLYFGKSAGKTLPELIEENEEEYRNLLRITDNLYQSEVNYNIDKTTPLAVFLMKIYLTQFKL